MSCVQAFTAALGFAMSAGWDWLPSMHRLWLRDYIEAVSMPTPFGFFGTLSGSIFFKMIMLLALCPVMERLFLAFPLDRVAFRRKPFPNADYALIPPAIRERIYLSTPLILAQLCAILLLLILTFFLPPCLDGLMPWLLGTISALFGLIWFVLVTLLPGVWSCISYGLAITFSILISLLLDAAPVESLARFRMLFPLLSIPLIFFAMPPSDDIRRRVRRHHRQRLFGLRVKGVLLRGLLLRRLSYLDILSKQGSVYLVLCVFPIMYGVQILLDFSIGCPMVSFNLMLDPPLERHAFLIMSGEISGAFLASSLIAFFPSHSLLVPMLGLSLFGCGSLLTAVFPSPPLNSVAFYIMQLSSGCCAAFALFVLHQFFQRSGFLFRTLSRALFLLTLFGSMGGYLLWKFADNIHNSYLGSHVLFMHLLTIGASLGLFFVYDPASVAAPDGHDAEAVAGRGVCADHSGRSVRTADAPRTRSRRTGADRHEKSGNQREAQHHRDDVACPPAPHLPEARTCATSTLCRYAPPTEDAPLALAERLPFPFLPEGSIEDTKKRFRIGLARPRNRF